MAKNIFESVSNRRPKSNKFDLSHERKMSLKFNKLYPMYLQEVVPGDSFNVKSEVFLRMAPMVTPVMHRVNSTVHYFFVPNRLVWNEWEDFITGGDDGASQPVYPKTEINSSTYLQFGKGTLADYFGIPVPSSGAVNSTVSVLPFRAYQTIYNEYFRDQNLEDKIAVEKTSGVISGTERNAITSLQTRAWEKDYFTSALPWSQRGGEAQIPLGNVEPIYKNVSEAKDSIDGSPTLSSDLFTNAAGDVVSSTPAGSDVRIENLETMSVDATTINELRKANALQRWLEKSARGGSRYIETIKSFFGVTSSDARLQRPEYLGGGRQPIVISEVLNTTGTAEAPQGDMAGHGISMGANNKFSRKFEEHGFIIGVVSIIPKTAYQQGLNRQWTKFDKFDHYWPEFANLGEQEIKVEELYSNFSDPTARDRVFGYQQRYAEYKYKESSVHGDFRDTLDNWHLGRIFDSEPVLNPTFIHADSRTNIFAVDDSTDYIWCQIYNQVSAIRPMPYFSIPTL